MTFILPDNILETLLCSFCHKYLSVKPTKVYPNRLIQCGRCVDNKEQSIANLEAVESQYGIIAENILFKCVNRFDGCRELLTYSQVKDHEQVCLEKNHKCPICYEEMASLLILRHFHSTHKDAVLDCSALVFNLNDHLEEPSVYIYQEEDNLFSLYISYRKSENTIKLDLVYMGCYKFAENIYHQFTVSNENKEYDIVLDSKPCSDNFFVVDTSHMSNLILIKFKLTDRNLKIFTASGVTTAVREPISTAISIEPAAPVREPIPKDAPLKLEPQSQIKHRSASDPYLKCYYCKEYCIFSLNDWPPIRTYYIDEQNKYVCYYCYHCLQYEGRFRRDITSQYLEREIPKEIIDNMGSFNGNCRYCRSKVQFSRIQYHEMKCECELGRQYTCPIPTQYNCCERGTVDEMIQHLQNEHRCKAYYGSYFKLPGYVPGRCYVFVNGYIVFLREADTVGYGNLEEKYIHVQLVTKTDNDDKSAYAAVFNSENEIITDLFKLSNSHGLFVKVFVA